MPDHTAATHLAHDTPVTELVQALVGKFAALWWESDTGTPPLKPTYTRREQASCEAHLDRFLDSLSSELKHPPQTPIERGATQERILAAFDRFARSGLGWQERHLEMLLSRGLTEATAQFTQMARRFDPTVSGADIFQANRNAWTAHGLQLLLGMPVQLTPAIFAYSMLYPYSDNYLDDPAIPIATKVAFNQRFSQRLAGEDVAPSNAHERNIWRLVGMIEGQFERAGYPQVFESLSAIHRAQVKSVGLLRQDAAPYEVDVLGISFEKGGTSVLADGYLVAGSLSAAQREFMFGYGAFLQLVDDLQDVHQDRKDGLLTIFSQSARRWTLDALTNRTFHFGAQVLQGLDGFDAPDLAPLKELMRDSTALLLVDAVGRADRLYSRRYRRELETHSPFRFSALSKRRKKLGRQRVSLLRLIEAFATPDDAASP